MSTLTDNITADSPHVLPGEAPPQGQECLIYFGCENEAIMYILSPVLHSPTGWGYAPSCERCCNRTYP